MLKFAFFAIFAVVSLEIATAQNYCNPALCNGGGQHIGCNNNGNFAAICRNPSMVSLTQAHRNIILRVHNRRRNQVAGGRTKLRPACRMATMEWDNELAQLAALNVRQCQMRHDACRNTNTFRQSGQNLVMMSFPRGTARIPQMLRRGVNQWFREIQNTQMSQINNYPSGYSGPAIGHFTVMVADRNIRVGCAAATFGAGRAGVRRLLMACNYATTNVVNRQIYDACAAPATGCTSGTNPNFPNLCSRAEQYAV